MLDYLACAFLPPGMKEKLPECGHEMLSVNVGWGIWKRWRKQKGEFGKIPCVRGENEEAQTHPAQQPPRAIHKFHFEEKKSHLEEVQRTRHKTTSRQLTAFLFSKLHSKNNFNILFFLNMVWDSMCKNLHKSAHFSQHSWWEEGRNSRRGIPC